MIEIFIIAAISAWLLYKLYKALGDPKYDPQRNIILGLKDKAKQLPSNDLKKQIEAKQIEDNKLGEAKYGFPLWSKVKDLQKVVPGFSAEEFSKGALVAFEQIIKTFAKGDKILLKGLLSADLYNSLEKEIDKSLSSEKHNEATIISVISNDILSINLDKKNLAEIVVKLVTDQVNLVRDKSGKILEGDPSHIDRITDIWTFSRNLSSANSNWLLAKISNS